MEGDLRCYLSSETFLWHILMLLRNWSLYKWHGRGCCGEFAYIISWEFGEDVEAGDDVGKVAPGPDSYYLDHSEIVSNLRFLVFEVWMILDCQTRRLMWGQKKITDFTCWGREACYFWHETEKCKPAVAVSHSQSLNCSPPASIKAFISCALSTCLQLGARCKCHYLGCGVRGCAGVESGVLVEN